MDAVGQLTAALEGRYAVDKEVGRGGMATVYLARDVRHNRKVALKVLNPELGAVLGVERFLAEIQVTANLQHPNLLPLFDSGEANGLLFYVMPFIEGESLRATLSREKQLPIDDAIRISAAIASALDYAHRHGVIHRDLKPENILMHDGQPLVADFGIALAVSKAGGDRITQTGLSLGTPQYMSPEQATGDREIDGRTDVYSLGALTYEMLVGEPPHDGKTSQAIIAKILTDKPRSLRLSRETVPAHVESAVTRALAKLPADRFHTAHEFADALSGRGFSVQVPAEAPGTTRKAPRWISALPWVVAAAALVFAFLSWFRGDTGTKDTRVLRYEVPLPPNVDVVSGNYAPVAISQHGRYLAFVATRREGGSRILLRSDDDLQAREIPGTEGAQFAMFSPDATQLAFVRSGQLMKVPVSGGRSEVVFEAGGGFRGATWSSSGWIVASNGLQLVKIPAVGGEAVPFSEPDSARGETFQINPVALPDGKTVLYASLTAGGGPTTRIGVASLEDGATTILDLLGSYPLGVIDGYLIFSTAAGTLMAAPFDQGGRRITGPSLALADQAAISASFGTTLAHMASDGSLAYVSGAIRRQSVLIAPDGGTRLLGEPCPCSWPRFSPDGKRVALSVGSLSQRDVWITDLPTGTPTRVTFGTAINDRPEWNADGSAIVYRSTEGGPRHGIWSVPLSGGNPTLLFGSPDSHIDEGVLSPDGKHLIVQRDRTSNGELWYASLGGDTTLRPVVPGPGVYGGRFSPDGKFVVYTSTQTGVEQVYVKPFPGLTGQTQVSTTGGQTPVWSQDGRRIYYVDGERLMVATIGSVQPFTIASRSPALSRGYSFLEVHADYDVARDGTILAFQPPGAGTQLIVVRNLAAELRARVRGAPR